MQAGFRWYPTWGDLHTNTSTNPRLEHQNVLEVGASVVKDLLVFEGEALARPQLLVDFGEPSFLQGVNHGWFFACMLQCPFQQLSVWSSLSQRA